MKLRKFKQKSILNIFKPANTQELHSPSIIEAWAKDVYAKNEFDIETQYAVLSEYFKYDVTKNIITNKDLNYKQKISAINHELYTCHEKARKSTMFSITQKIASWVVPIFIGGTIGVCFGNVLGSRIGFEIKRSALESQMADATAQEFLVALNDLKAEMRNGLFNHFMIEWGCILAFCLITGVLYKVYCSPILDKVTDLESARSVMQDFDR